MNIGNRQVTCMIALGGMLINFVLIASADFSAAQTQLSIASKEAVSAATSKDTNTVHRHLQRLINCLVGMQGEEFDLDVGNPCAEQDSSAMRDLKPVPGIKMLVEQALNLAKTGLLIEAVGPAQDVAQAAGKILTRASQKVAEEHNGDH
jgi:hypothetical protein